MFFSVRSFGYTRLLSCVYDMFLLSACCKAGNYEISVQNPKNRRIFGLMVTPLFCSPHTPDRSLLFRHPLFLVLFRNFRFFSLYIAFFFPIL